MDLKRTPNALVVTPLNPVPYVNGFLSALSREFNVYINSLPHQHGGLAWKLHVLPAFMSLGRGYKVMRRLSPVFNPPHRLSLSPLKEQDVDLLITLDPLICNVDLRKFKNAKKIYIAVDTHIERHRKTHLISMRLNEYDLVYVAHVRNLGEYASILGRNTVKHLPLWYDELTYKPLTLRKDIDICFVGTMTSDRERVLKEISRAFPNYEIFYGTLYGRDVNVLYNRSRIVINLSRRKEVNFRVFETLGSGAFLLTDYNEEVEEYFKTGEHLETFNDLTELLKKCDYYRNSDERERIAKKGHELVRHRDSSEVRVRQILDQLQRR